MSSNKPWLDGPTSRDHAMDKIKQGGPFCLIGLMVAGGTYFFFGFVWIWSVILAICGFFWMVVGLITLLTGIE